MPTYEYICDACEHELEEFQSITADPLKKCPECGKNKLRRLIGTGAGIIFKGSGFYETDYRSDGYKKAEKAEKDSKSDKPEKKPDTKSEKRTDSKNKPEAKADRPKARQNKKPD